MLTINRVEESGRCVFCGKEKEVAAVVMEGKKEVLLCWADVRKHAAMHMRMNGQAKAITVAQSAVASVGPAK